FGADEGDPYVSRVTSSVSPSVWATPPRCTTLDSREGAHELGLWSDSILQLCEQNLREQTPFPRLALLFADQFVPHLRPRRYWTNLWAGRPGMVGFRGRGRARCDRA